jgi:hypothetical protein
MLKVSPLALLLLAVTQSVTAAPYTDRQPVYPAYWHKPDSMLLRPEICDSIEAPDVYTMMMVYRSFQPDTVQTLLSFVADSTSHITHTRNVSVPVIYTLYHKMPLDTALYDSCILYVGASKDSISQIGLYESAYFPQHLSLTQSLMFQTYLALHHGITLHHSNYISTRGDVLWHAKRQRKFYHHIQGIGADPFYGYYASKSVSAEDSLVSIYVFDSIPQYAYALIGDDDAPIDWMQYEGNWAILQRKWSVHRTGNIPTLSLAISTTNLPEFSDTLWLVGLTDHDQIKLRIPPTTIDSSGVAHFVLPHTISYFSFLCRSEHQRTHSKGKEDSNLSNANIGNSFTLSPNPTHGDFYMDISLSMEQTIIITIHDTAGKILHSEALASVQKCRYNGQISGQGVYIISITDIQNNTLATYQLLVY